MPEQLPIILTSRDFAILESLVPQWGEPFPGAAETLRRKLAPASVVFPADIPEDVVTLNSRVRFHVDGGLSQDRQIVGGPSEAMYGLTILLLSPRGLAMIGNAEGHLVRARRKDGSSEALHIEKVLFQPERKLSLEQGRADEKTGVVPFRRAHSRAGSPVFAVDDDPGPSAA